MTVAMAAGLAAAFAIDFPAPREISWQSKVHPRVLAAAAREEQEILVVLADRPDLAGARDLPTRQEKTRFVFERLTEAAARSQASLIAELRASGVEHQSFWIANAVHLAFVLSSVLSSFAKITAYRKGDFQTW